MARQRTGLGHDPEFIKLWAGQTVSKFGTHITGTALSALAVLVLGASPAQMGLLGALGGLPVLVIGLVAGVWVDRLHRRPIMLSADLGRAMLLASIPAAALLGHLRIEQLYVVVALVGVLTILYDLADRAFLPTLVSREQLVEANARLSASDSVAEIAGPALAGTLVQILTAPLAILLDAFTYLFSAASLMRIRRREPPLAVDRGRQRIWHEAIEGLQVIVDDPVLRPLAFSMGTFEFFGSFIGTVYWLFLVRELGLSPALIGLAIGVGGAGALVGALVSGSIGRWLGAGPTLIVSLIAGGCVGLILPLARGPQAVLVFLVLATQFMSDIPFALYFIHERSIRQARIPQHLLGRANASMDLVARGATPIGALLAGILGGIAGLRLTWVMGATGIVLGSAWLILSPVRQMKEPPEPGIQPDALPGEHPSPVDEAANEV